MLSYLRLCLANNSSLRPSRDLLNEPELISSSSRNYIDRLLSDNGPVTVYLDFALELLSAHPSKVPLQCILEVVAGVPKLSAVLLSKLDTFKNLLHHNKEDVRELAAQIVAVVACHSYTPSQLDNMIGDLSRSLKEKPLEQQHGSILALGYTIGRIVRDHLTDGTQSRRELEKSAVEGPLFARLSPAVKVVVDFLLSEAPHALVLSSACLSVGEMGRCGPLLDVGGADSSRAIEKLLKVVNDVKIGSKIREKAALAAGYLSLGEVEYPKRKFVIEHFLTSAQVSLQNFKIKLSIILYVCYNLESGSEGCRSSIYHRGGFSGCCSWLQLS